MGPGPLPGTCHSSFRARGWGSEQVQMPCTAWAGEGSRLGEREGAEGAGAESWGKQSPTVGQWTGQWGLAGPTAAKYGVRWPPRGAPTDGALPCVPGWAPSSHWVSKGLCV